MGEGFSPPLPPERLPKPASPAESPHEQDLPRVPEREQPAEPTSELLRPALVRGAESYDRRYWTPDRIRGAVSNFFEQMNRNEVILRARRESLMQEAVKETEARRQAEKEIAEKEMQEAEMKRKGEIKQQIEETEAEIRFRGTIEWMVEQSHDQIQDLALNFLRNVGVQDQNADNPNPV